MSILKSAPYSLIDTAEVKAKVKATNIKGFTESVAGNGATIISTPDAPINLAEDTS